jgi:acyl-CoA dehydrogenase
MMRLSLRILVLLVMRAAWELDQGRFARTEVSMAKIYVANVLHQAADIRI